MDLKIYSPQDFPTYLPKLSDLYDDLFSGGKGFRAKLTDTVACGLQLPESTRLLLCQTVEFIHNSSLLHDDLVDRSSLRRGKTTAWLKYTPEYAVLAGDYLLARVMVNLSSFGNIELLKTTSQAISDLLEGEWLQDSHVKNIQCTFIDVDRVHRLKTGSLFKWCLVAPFIAKNIYDVQVLGLLQRTGDIFGQLLQRSDDLLDFNIRNFENKAVMGDIQAGYINSFCALLFEDYTIEQKQQAFAKTDLQEFKNFIGNDVFEEQLKDFDARNEELIADSERCLQELAEHSQGLYRDVAQALMPLAPLLYWRQQ